MAINITKLINAVSGIVGNLDSDNTLTELNRGTIAAQEVNEARDALSFATVADFETADSTNEGNIVYASSTKKYYVSIHNRWAPINLTGPSTTAPAAPSSLIVQGSSYGYTTGGAASPVLNNTQSLTQILQFSFTSDGNATDVGDINPAVPLGRVASSSQTSSTHGYHSGGLVTPPQITSTNNIQKWSFTSPYNGSDVADLSSDTFRPFGSSSPTDGYSTGGRGGTPIVYLTVHDKFPTSSDTNATDNGDLTAGRYQTGGGNSSSSASYFAGGSTPTGAVNIIEKIPFAAGGTATDVGDLTTPNINSTGANTSDHGYTLGGSNNGYAEANLNVIQRFSYSSDGNATDYADLANGVYTGAGCSSTSYGYTTGGQSSPGAPQAGAAINVIQKFPFSTATNGTDVGDLTSILANHSGNQN